ncbi:hypothetical protein CWM66_18785 [Kosakonia sp. H7A]|nr:hypothetical protein CWM66_18785 [Kosakonia sp. H7A]
MKTRPAGGKCMQDNDDGMPRAQAVITVLHWLVFVAGSGCIVWICIGCGDSAGAVIVQGTGTAACKRRRITFSSPVISCPALTAIS